MIDVTIDFETYYDKDYSLKSLMTAEYIRDPRFEIIGVSYKVGDSPIRWFTGDLNQTKAELGHIDWRNARVVAHNALFDGAILEWMLGFRPAKYFCTMMGSRPHIVPYTDSMSLAAVAEYLGVGTKGTEVENHKGRHRADFTAEQILRYAAYCTGDVELASKIAEHLKGILPPDEQDLIDLTIKKFVRPVLLLDEQAIAQRAEELKLLKAAAVDSVKLYGMQATSLRSRPKFLAKMKELGVEISKKATVNSKGEATETEAMSKKDPAFLELLAHPNEQVRKIVAAKLELGSTIEESRIARFRRLYHSQPGHLLPIPLLYYGAHPGRFSGLDGLNMQNLPRLKKSDPGKGALRRAIVAPPGYMIVAADFSNIEARIVATLARQWDLVEAFRLGEDIYAGFASRMYARTIEKIRDPVERFVGKTCILGLGYGMGYKKLQLTLATADTVVILDNKQASNAVYLYRQLYGNIPALWSFLEEKVRAHVLAPSGLNTWDMLTFLPGRIVLPNGMPIIYNGLTADKYTGQMKYGAKFLWGGSVLENVSQALARIIATRAELRLAKAGLPAVHQAHDELIFCVPEQHVDACENVITRVMTDPVPWMPKLPIAVEVHHGRTYGDCK